MLKEQINSENRLLHWKHIECQDQIVIDLGCGRWEHAEYRDPSWPTTPEYLLQLGASKVYAFDIDPKEIEWYRENICPKHPNLEAFAENINGLDIIRRLYQQIKPNVIKCDIEHNEKFILELSDEEFSSVNFYAIETHSPELYSSFMHRFNKLGYKILAVIDLIHAPLMNVIFAQKD